MHEITPTVSSPDAKELEKYEVIYWENHPVDYTLLALEPFFFYITVVGIGLKYYTSKKYAYFSYPWEK